MASKELIQASEVIAAMRFKKKTAKQINAHIKKEFPMLKIKVEPSIGFTVEE